MEEEVKEESKKETKEENNKIKGNYFLGILGGILGGFIATIPWILVYVYGNMMLSALAVVIAVGIFYGYKLFNGKTTKFLPVFVMTFSVIIVIVTMLLLIPTFLLQSEGIAININTIKSLYSNTEFTEGITKDAMIAIIFSILGASIITRKINIQLKNGKTEDIDLSNNEELTKLKKDYIQKIRPLFEKFNALEKDHGILKDDLNAEINENNELKIAFNYLKSCGIIKKTKGRFYYSKEAEDKQITVKKKINSKVVSVIIAIILIVVMVGLILFNQIENSKPIEVSDEVIKFEVESGWEEYTTYYNGEWNYYKYINTAPPENDVQIEEGDYSKYPAYINVSYYSIDKEQLSNIEDVKNSMKEYITSLEIAPEVYDEEITRTIKGYDVLKIKMIFHQLPEQVEYAYYILKDDMLVCLDTYSFNLKDDAEIKETIEKMIESFEWNE